jgi:FKBP-type peptidyl-prolyl cis-trans isomerase SlyD
MKIENEKVVTMHFTVMDKEKTVIDSTYDAEPLAFIQGSGLLVPALEEALFGLAANDKKSVALTAEQAYGERFEQLIQSMPKTMFEGMDVNVGMQFRATTDDGEQTVIVVDISDDKIIVDGNHPLAGIDLTFDVEVLEVREATTDELSHGHIHAQGESCGHSHH